MKPTFGSITTQSLVYNCYVYTFKDHLELDVVVQFTNAFSAV